LQQCLHKLGVLTKVLHCTAAQCSLLQVLGNSFMDAGGAILTSLQSSKSAIAITGAARSDTAEVGLERLNIRCMLRCMGWGGAYAIDTSHRQVALSA
jgi:hypothetical protein